MKKNFLLDVLLFVSGVICIVTGVLMDFHLLGPDREFRHFVRSIHTYTGYIMAVGLIFHIAWHGGWIKSAVKTIFKKN